MPEVSPEATVKPSGYMRLPLRLRRLIADALALGAFSCAWVAVFSASDIAGLWLRRPALLGLALVLIVNWLAWRRLPRHLGRITRQGLFVSGAGLGLLCMTFHLAGGVNTLAGLAGLLACMALRNSYDDPDLAAEAALRAARSGDLRGPVTVIRDNIENLALSLVVVVLVWHFCLEAFRIPTGSMLPTLYGDPVWGDRVLVDKFIYEFRDPERWEPTVFRYPLRRTDPYVKRIIGMPGEQVLIAQGDIYLRRHPGAEVELLQKTPAAREVLWYPVTGPVTEKGQFLKWFAREGEADFDSGAIKLGKGAVVTFPKGDDGKPGDVRDHDPSGEGFSPEIGYNRRVVGDLRTRGAIAFTDRFWAEITLVRDTESYVLRLSSPAEDHYRYVDVALTHRSTAPGTMETGLDLGEMKRVDIPGGSTSRKTLSFDLSLADGQLSVTLWGNQSLWGSPESWTRAVRVGSPMLDLLRAQPKDRPLSEVAQALTEPTPRRGRVSFSGGAVSDAESGHSPQLIVHGIERDVYYLGRILDTEVGGKTEQRELPFGFNLGPDEYLVLGDNSPGSKDSRFWTAIDLVTQDGTLFTGGVDDEGQIIASLLNSFDAGEQLVFKDAASGRTAPCSALRSLTRVARFSHKERGSQMPTDAEILKNTLEGLKRAAQKQNLTRLHFITEGGGVVYVPVDEIREIRVRAVAGVKRELFVGKPFAVFLWPHRMKLIQ